MVEAKEHELMKLQMHLDKVRGTHQSGFSLNKSINPSETESVRTQLVDLQHELESEKRRTDEVMSKQTEELEEAKKKAGEGDEAQKKMRARMAEL